VLQANANTTDCRAEMTFALPSPRCEIVESAVQAGPMTALGPVD
jgi:hypothetical protein